jgi:hypothetical protein
MVIEDPAREKMIERLRDVRHALLRLHKILLDYQRELRERRTGKIENSYELLNLVMHDPEFAWLHRLSELVVYIDEIFAAEEPPTESNAEALLSQARSLLMPSEVGDDFQRQYFTALQQSPDVVLAHSEVVGLLGKRNTQIH